MASARLPLHLWWREAFLSAALASQVKLLRVLRSLWFLGISRESGNYMRRAGSPKGASHLSSHYIENAQQQKAQMDGWMCRCCQQL
ncbi:hypothetical protein P171DRAFT_434379 [Karstenula rhodostoma CBS 690.94]|uniref:Uncharacterized protein n=1 Tax=Karstenula rhodostoma CBS 690.94 TaxID=1392251 RepID=A0A9P4PDA4_9PLEO|nr:hypothetical protein P171DRAFT_434379 [Karstenula rhodostoma CBS 690.94]